MTDDFHFSELLLWFHKFRRDHDEILRTLEKSKAEHESQVAHLETTQEAIGEEHDTIFQDLWKEIGSLRDQIKQNEALDERCSSKVENLESADKVEALNRKDEELNSALESALEEVRKLSDRVTFLEDTSRDKTQEAVSCAGRVNDLNARVNVLERQLTVWDAENGIHGVSKKVFVPVATTEDDTVDLDHRRRPSAMFHITLSDDHPATETTESEMVPERELTTQLILQNNLRTFKQDDMLVSNYIQRGDQILREVSGPDQASDTNSEHVLVEAFLRGLNHLPVRRLFERYLLEHGFSWANVLRSHEKNMEEKRRHLATQRKLPERTEEEKTSHVHQLKAATKMTKSRAPSQADLVEPRRSQRLMQRRTLRS